MSTTGKLPAPGDSTRLRQGDRLPSLPVSGRAGGTSLRHGAGPRVVLALHHARCEECVGYAERIASVLDQIREWGGDIVAVIPGPPDLEAPRLTRAGVALLRDTERVFAAGEAAVLVADEWGEVYFASEPGDSHGAPSPEEVLEWVKFIAIQCPECEGPEGPWRSLQ